MAIFILKSVNHNHKPVSPGVHLKISSKFWGLSRLSGRVVKLFLSEPLTYKLEHIVREQILEAQDYE